MMAKDAADSLLSKKKKQLMFLVIVAVVKELWIDLRPTFIISLNDLNY